MSDEIYDRQGKVVGWIVDSEDIFNRSNHYVGFIDGNELFSRSAKYLGEFADGYFWDGHGKAVAFIDGATHGPMTPIPQIPPIPPIHPITPIKPITPIAPIPPVRSLAWSSIAFAQLFL